MKGLSKFSNQVLSKNEMSVVKGGGAVCTCMCSSQQGAWTGYYETRDQIVNAVNEYCEGGGRCQCQTT